MNKKIFHYIISALILLSISFSGAYAWTGLFASAWDVLSNTKWNEMITELNTKLSASDVLAGTWITVTASGSDVVIWTAGISWNPIPDIMTTTQLIFPISTTGVIHLEWDDFTPTSTVTIPGFVGTLNSVSIISQSKIDVNVTTWTSTGTYDFVVSNNGVLNTLWSWNGVGLLQVVTDITIIGDDISWRKWNNGSHATSCNGYKNPTAPKVYSGDIGSGQYLIKPDANPAFMVYCDMTTSWWGWTRIEYTADLVHQAQFSWGDLNRWLPIDFSLSLTSSQINAIRAVSSEGKQTYRGTCQWVIHYRYPTSNYDYAFGFRFHQGHETAFNQQMYPSTNITVPVDGCLANNNTLSYTDFDIVDIRVPVINVHSRDNSSTEQFGSPLTTYPAWFR